MDNVSIINEDKEENINVSDTIQENINNNISDTIQEGLDNEPSLKIATENISLDTTFASWEEAEIFLEEYGRRNGFSINKYRISRNKSSQLITKRTFTCEFGGKFKSNKKETGNQRNTRTKKRQCPWHINLTFPEHATNITISLFENEHNHELRSDTCEFNTGIESTSRVEGMNAIIKKTVRSNSTLCQLVDQLSERLISEIQWGRFHEYRSSTTSSISVSIGEDLFPSVIKIMEKYLCINTITAIKVEMAQCLYLQATIALFSELDFTQEQEIEGFIEDSYDAQQITLQSIIDEIGKEDVKEIWKICDIRPERWYQDVYQGKPLTQETGLIFLHENENLENNTNNDLEIRIPTLKAITIPKTVPIMKKAIEKRKKYGKLWGMAREATLLALESNDNEMELILQDYINKKKRNYEMISESNTEIEMEQNHINESTNISNEFQELGNIQNPLKAKTKGRPPTKRYRSSIEHEKGESSKSGCSSRNTYKCLICGQCGHNAAYHKNDKLKERQQ
ncbi:unnamed protein product [Rhizophagus irregularis]|uniref:FAR1 domain-containing protein n=1 Tax=Rhizophagus irregularis TaxID=588596 RepID=A0A915ZR74_9GLOM|nr:unnamed protein product [Rhizophagus irregularis]